MHSWFVVSLSFMSLILGLRTIDCNLNQNRICNSGNLFLEQNPAIVNFNWTLNQGKTSTLYTGPDVDKTSGTNQGYYYYIEASGPQVSLCVIL